MDHHISILLAGCGKMGSALLNGWLRSFQDISITVLEPSDISLDPRVHHVRLAADLEDDLAPSLVVLAVKPQTMEEVCPLLSSRIIAGTPVLSIAAGKTLDYLSTMFGQHTPLIRSMPNTPAAIGYGITVACPNSKVNNETKSLADRLLSAGGMVEWIDNEALMDAVTAVSGSGPAYVFLLMEELAHAGQAAGLPQSLAIKLAKQTVIGSALLAQNQGNIPADRLRENVTSPNGTTAAALDVLMSANGLSNLMQKAVIAATKRSRELAKN